MSVATSMPAIQERASLQPLWHRAAPRRLAKSCATGNLLDGWAAWRKHLARRKRPISPPFLHGRQPALLWGWPADWERSAALKPGTSSISIVEHFDKCVVSYDNQVDALATLAAAYVLPELADELSAEAWWRIVERLWAAVNESQRRQVDWQCDSQAAVQQQLLAGELPLALSYLFPELQSFRALRGPARIRFSEALVDWTDGQGLLHAQLLPVFGPLWACWTRARWMGERLKRGCWSCEAEVQYQWLVRHAIRLTDRHGRLVLANSGAVKNALARPRDRHWPKGLYAAALELAGDRGDCAAAAAALPARAFPRQVRFNDDDLPDPALNSEWSGLAVLANGWSRSAARLALAYADDPLLIDLAVGCDRLLAGPWTSRTTCNDLPVRVEGAWECLCWQSDSACDLLELGVELSHGLRLERQILLARKDRILLLADAIIAADSQPRELWHAMDLPLDSAAIWQPEAETRDGILAAGECRAAVLPLALVEWRSDPRGGRLDAVDGRLTLAQKAHGRAIYCPLVIDVDRRRAARVRTWRQLTVGENLAAVPRDAAVGFRAQAGRDQWLVYRSLARAANRTVLGQNIAGEFCAGRFKRSGQLDEWIEIEACE